MIIVNIISKNFTHTHLLVTNGNMAKQLTINEIPSNQLCAVLLQAESCT